MRTNMNPEIMISEVTREMDAQNHLFTTSGRKMRAPAAVMKKAKAVPKNGVQFVGGLYGMGLGTWRESPSTSNSASNLAAKTGNQSN